MSGRNVPGRGQREPLMPRPKGRMYLKDRKRPRRLASRGQGEESYKMMLPRHVGPGCTRQCRLQ